VIHQCPDGKGKFVLGACFFTSTNPHARIPSQNKKVDNKPMTTNEFKQFIPSEDQMLAFGAQLGPLCGNTAVIFLYGNLGAGKTTLTRGFLRGLGYEGRVKSPTYTIVEPYQINQQKVYHFDFYRLQDPEELEFIGIQDYLVPEAISLIEWPEQGAGILPTADLSCYIEPELEGRQIRIEAHSAHGRDILKHLNVISDHGK
jgi:tRNA threonylcarbamoyladenosine biosynthesis protein TsaE